MDFEKTVLISVLGRPVTAYALCVALALGAGAALFLLRGKKRGIKEDTLWTAVLLALPMGLLGARLFYCAARLNLYLEIGLDAILRLWDGGYALWGAVGGAALAGFLAARVTGERGGRVLDAMAAPGALVIALCRFAEYFSGEGVGLYVENEALWRFPFAVYNDFNEAWYYAVFLLEGLAALAVFVSALRGKKGQGNTARLFLLLYSSCQIVLESMRRDNFLTWLFVRVSQLTAALVIAGMMAAAVIRWARNKKGRRMSGGAILGCWCVVLGCVGLCVALEFSVDGKIWADLPVWAAYALMACACAGIGASAYKVIFGAVKN